MLQRISIALCFLACAVTATAQDISWPGYARVATPAAPKIEPYFQRYQLSVPSGAHRLPAFTDAQPSRDEKGRALIGAARELSGTPAPVLQKRVNGGYVTLWAVVTPGAKFIRARLVNLDLPAGATIFFASHNNPNESYGPYDAAQAVGNALWSPPVRGEGVLIELFTPHKPDAAPFRVSHVMHGYRDARDTNAAAGPCHQEVATAFSEVAKSVGLLDFVDDQREAVCSGTLLSNQTNDQTPFFITAGQCLLNPTGAQSARVYWNYNTGDTPPDSTAFTDGAVIIAGALENDFVLLRLTGTLPSGLFFAGWSNTPLFLPNTPVTSLHHPNASHKRMSAGRTNSSCPFDLLPLCLTFVGVTWNTGAGVTETGSDGGGLWTGTGTPALTRFVGLLGINQSNCDTPTNSDFYSRFSSIYNNISTYMTQGGNAAPPNNNFANAQAGLLPLGVFAGNNIRATKETGEPNHAGNPGGASVWYRWQATQNGELVVSTAGSDFDTLLGVYTGSSVNNLTAVGSNDDLAPGVTFSQVNVNVTSGTTYYFAVDGKNGATGGILINYNVANGFRFASAAVQIGEEANFATITVERTDPAQAASVDYAIEDQTATQRTDYTLASGTLNFAAGEASKTFDVLINNDAYEEGPEAFRAVISNPVNGQLGALTQALVSITDNDTGTPTTNPVDEAQFFVRQQYADFLNREPDSPGLAYWTDQITQCRTDAACINARRIGVSAAFYIELEFQETGSFVYRFYQASYGARPAYAQFMPDRARIIGGAQLEASKQAFAMAWVQRAAFTTKYPTAQTAEQFIDALLATVQTGSGVNLTGQRPLFLSEYNAQPNQTAARARVARLVADAQAFQNAEYNKGFVLMQYFGYLRRDPDQAGYDFWLSVLNQQPQNFRGMVCAFVTSQEYQERYSSVVTRTNQLCNGNPLLFPES